MQRRSNSFNINHSVRSQTHRWPHTGLTRVRQKPLWRRADWRDTSGTFSPVCPVTSAIKVFAWEMTEEKASCCLCLSFCAPSPCQLPLLPRWGWGWFDHEEPHLEDFPEWSQNTLSHLLSNCCQGQVHPRARNGHPGVTSVTPVVTTAAKQSLSLIWENNPAHNPHWADGCSSKVKCF